MTHNKMKTILFPERYGNRSSITFKVASPEDKMTSLYGQSYMHRVFPFKLLTSRIKKGSGKGKLRMQKVVIKQRNLFDNLTWCV